MGNNSEDVQRGAALHTYNNWKGLITLANSTEIYLETSITWRSELFQQEQAVVEVTFQQLQAGGIPKKKKQGTLWGMKR